MEDILIQIGYVRILILLVIFAIIFATWSMESTLSKILVELKKLNGKKNPRREEGEIKPQW